MSRPHLYIDEIKSPIGTLLLMSNGKYIVRIDYGTMERPPANLLAWLIRNIKNANFFPILTTVNAASNNLTEFFSEIRQPSHSIRSVMGRLFRRTCGKP